MYYFLNKNKLLQDFINDCNEKYNISYSFNPDFKEDLINSQFLNASRLSNFTLTYDEYIYDYRKVYSGTSIHNTTNFKIDLKKKWNCIKLYFI